MAGFDAIGRNCSCVAHVADVTDSASGSWCHSAEERTKQGFTQDLGLRHEGAVWDVGDCAFIRLPLKPRHIPYSCGRARVRFSTSGPQSQSFPLNIKMSPSGIFEGEGEGCIQIQSLDMEWAGNSYIFNRNIYLLLFNNNQLFYLFIIVYIQYKMWE